MPRPVFPVVRLPYDQPDRVVRVLDTVRRELRASHRRQSAVATAIVVTGNEVPNHDREPLSPPPSADTTMTAQVQQQHAAAGEPEMLTDTGMDAGTAAAVEQMTVGVRDCTLTPKTRPEITVTTNLQDTDDRQRPAQSAIGGGTYLLVPPVNITAEISRPPLTSFQHQYHHHTATS